MVKWATISRLGDAAMLVALSLVRSKENPPTLPAGFVSSPAPPINLFYFPFARTDQVNNWAGWRGYNITFNFKRVLGAF